MVRRNVSDSRKVSGIPRLTAEDVRNAEDVRGGTEREARCRRWRVRWKHVRSFRRSQCGLRARGGAARRRRGRRAAPALVQHRPDVAGRHRARLDQERTPGPPARGRALGAHPGWAKDVKIGARAFNARSEEVEDKPMFRNALIKRRAVIPASATTSGRPPTRQDAPLHPPRRRFAAVLRGALRVVEEPRPRRRRPRPLGAELHDPHARCDRTAGLHPRRMRCSWIPTSPTPGSTPRPRTSETSSTRPSTPRPTLAETLDDHVVSAAVATSATTPRPHRAGRVTLVATRTVLTRAECGRTPRTARASR